MTEYCFVIDIEDRKLSPTKVNKAWYLIRKGRAELVSKYPMIVKLRKEVKEIEVDKVEFICGIDDGSSHVGIAIAQKCRTKNKVVFKGTIEQRQDVKRLLDERRVYRHYHRKHKRYRQVRFNNRSNSKRKGRLAPSIKQKKDSILRVVNKINHWCPISQIVLEDVQIDIRALTEGIKPYKWEYQKSNRLDENLRKATLMRDGYKCMGCGKMHCILEVHHIVPRRLHGADTLRNLITLCSHCHEKTLGIEEKFIERYQKLIDGKSVRFDYAMHVMQGKSYLRRELNDIAPLKLTVGSETANKRIDWDIEKSHSNDAVVITGLGVRYEDFNLLSWIIRPIRRKSKIELKSQHHIKHGDLVTYSSKKSGLICGWVSEIRKRNGAIKIRTLNHKDYGPYSYIKVKLVYRYSKIYFVRGW